MKRWSAWIAIGCALAGVPAAAQGQKPSPAPKKSTNAEAARLIAQADTLAEKGKYEEAAALLQKAAELTPDDWALWDRVGWAHLDNGKLPEARKAFEAARKAAPPRTPLLGGPIVVAYGEGKKDELKALLGELVSAGRMPAVMAVVEKGLAARPFSLEWNYALGYLYANVLRNSDRALSLIESVVKADPKRADAWLLLVDINRDLDRAAQEDAAAVKFLELAPESPDAFRLRAERAAALREYGAAIAEYKAGIAKAPGADGLYYQLARVYERTGAAKEAEATYRQLIAYAEANKLEEVRRQARAALGAFHCRQRNYVEAQKYYAEAAGRPEATVNTWETWAATLVLTGKWDEAARAMQGAVERLARSRGSEDVESRDALLIARYRAGIYEVAAGRRDDAARTLAAALAGKSAIRTTAELEVAAFLRWLSLKEPEGSGLAYQKGDERWAAFLWREVQADPGSGEREVRGRFDPIATAWRAVLQQVQKANPDAWPADYALARIYASVGFNEEGLELLRKAIRRKGDWWALHFALGQYYARQRDKENGIDALRRTLQLAPECRQARVYLSLLTNLKTDDDDDAPP